MFDHHPTETGSSLSFPSDLVRGVHARVIICVSRAFCSTDQEKKETARNIAETGSARGECSEHTLVRREFE